MDKLKEHIENADVLLARLSASGDAMMLIATVRSDLKAALGIIRMQAEAVQESGEGGDKNGG